MMDSSSVAAIALTAHSHPDAIVAYRADRVTGAVVAVTQQHFFSDVMQLAVTFPANEHLLNFCKNRYCFMVGVAAALVSKKISLLPSTDTATVIAQVRGFAPDVFCLLDEESTIVALADMQLVRYPAQPATAKHIYAVPDIPIAQVVAYVFTSGSTGMPVPHAKTWGKLVQNARTAQQRLQLAPGTTLIGTVPPQHMYGFETIVMLALHGGCAVWEGHPFHSSEISACLKNTHQPRVLVTTPVHLRALLNAGIDYPAVQGILCATAPLPMELALAAEQCLKGPLTEIYGCTETGQLATRRTTETAQWHLHEGITLEAADGNYQASGGHVEEKVILNDVLLPQGERHFLLQGRNSDLVNIAGKRSSLNYLGHQLLAIEGVLDGCYFMPQADADEDGALPDTMRLCAVAVAPDIQAKDIIRALRQRIDAVFLPRPLILLNKLPRNATGKMPQAVLQKLWQNHTQRKAKVDVPRSEKISAQHPAFAGHFPGDPLLPGVVLLDKLLLKVQKHYLASVGLTHHRIYIESAKFLHSVRPNDKISFQYEAQPAEQNSRLKFQIHCQTTLVADCVLMLLPAQ